MCEKFSSAKVDDFQDQLFDDIRSFLNDLKKSKMQQEFSLLDFVRKENTTKSVLKEKGLTRNDSFSTRQKRHRSVDISMETSQNSLKKPLKNRKTNNRYESQIESSDMLNSSFLNSTQ